MTQQIPWENDMLRTLTCVALGTSMLAAPAAADAHELSISLGFTLPLGGIEGDDLEPAEHHRHEAASRGPTFTVAYTRAERRRARRRAARRAAKINARRAARRRARSPRVYRPRPKTYIPVAHHRHVPRGRRSVR